MKKEKKEQKEFCEEEVLKQITKIFHDPKLKKNFVMNFDFKKEDKEFSQNKLKTQRKEFYSLAKK